ncbi:MAG: IS30 family transposase [Verrucomicrobiota bacterium]
MDLGGQEAGKDIVEAFAGSAKTQTEAVLKLQQPRKAGRKNDDPEKAGDGGEAETDRRLGDRNGARPGQGLRGDSGRTEERNRADRKNPPGDEGANAGKNGEPAVGRKERVKTITADNGCEFHNYKELESILKTKVYFATPHHAWERGTTENTNGLIRQYLPKGMDLSRVTQDRCNRIAEKLNNHPRKRLDFRTPNEVYDLNSLVALQS